MPVGHSVLLSLSSACRSFLGTGTLDNPHRFYFIFFRIAIWNRNIVISLICVGVWAGALALNIWSTSFLQSWFALSSHFPYLCLQRLDSGAKLTSGGPMSLYS